MLLDNVAALRPLDLHGIAALGEKSSCMAVSRRTSRVSTDETGLLGGNSVLSLSLWSHSVIDELLAA